MRSTGWSTIMPGVARQERQVRDEDALAVRRARHSMQQVVEPLHLSDERGDVVLLSRLEGAPPDSRSRVCGSSITRISRRPAPARCAWARSSRRCSLRQHVDESVGIGRHDRLAHRQRFEHRQRRALPE